MRKFTTISAAALAAAAIAGFAGQASAQVFDCDAKGNRQEKGALLGAVVGGVIGNNVSKKNGAPIVGALAGAAAGSAIGCSQQEMRERDRARMAYVGNSVATTTVKIRKGPSTRSQQIGTLARGERTEVLRYEGDWAVIGYKGNYGSRQTGYVAAAYLRDAR